ncbi:hypothetical protein EVAR_22209_1 [Eumeta japonica]|uniref:Uncharacterized protein n=1 Tax=Eumeta variegata TaxID=151549 RepID=A0A4C1UAF0_EUMVA|nr:hypothetical protein EVAR_22209_1 [Eumeta japonica]
MNASAPASAAAPQMNTNEGVQVTAATVVEKVELLSPVAYEQVSWTSPRSGFSSSSDSEYVREKSSIDIRCHFKSDPGDTHLATDLLVDKRFDFPIGSNVKQGKGSLNVHCFSPCNGIRGSTALITGPTSTQERHTELVCTLSLHMGPTL